MRPIYTSWTFQNYTCYQVNYPLWRHRCYPNCMLWRHINASQLDHALSTWTQCLFYINEKTAATWSGYLVVSVDLVTNMNRYVAMMYWTCADDEFYQVTDSLKPGNNVIFSECDILHGLHSVPGYLICMEWWFISLIFDSIYTGKFSCVSIYEVARL